MRAARNLLAALAIAAAVAMVLLEAVAERRRLIYALLLGLLIGLLTGCSTTVERLVPVNVAVPVPCQVLEPERPALAIDSMPPDAPVDVQAREMRADHDLRDGYEGQLRAALRACITPSQPSGVSP